MRDAVSIGASKAITTVRNRLAEELSSLRDEGLQISLEEKDYGSITYIGCNLTDDGNSRNAKAIFRYYIAKILAEVIAHDLPLSEIPRIIRVNYAHFSEEEKAEIINRAINLYKSELYQGNIYKAVRRKNQIITSLLEYLNLNNEVVLEGFLRFRLKEFCDELSTFVDRAVDSYMVDREYDEFVALLRYFVEIQEPKMPLVHVVIRSNGLYRILDERKEVVETEYLEGFVVDLVQHQVDYEDLLLSALITLAPREIIIHLDPDSKVARTVSRVFEGQTALCQERPAGCPLCSYNGALTNKE